MPTPTNVSPAGPISGGKTVTDYSSLGPAYPSVAPVGDAFSKSPLICASTQKLPSEYAVYSSAPRVVVRQRLKPASGKWAAIGFVFVNFRKVQGSGTITNSNEYEGDLQAYKVAAAIELADGNQATKHYDSPNSGGTMIRVTFEQGEGSTIVQPGRQVVSDLLWAQDYGKTSWEWPDTTAFPWIHSAFGSLDDTVNLAMPGIGRATAYYWPINDRLDEGQASWSAAVGTLMTAGQGNIDQAPEAVARPLGCLMMIGVPLDNQTATMVIGTSIEYGEGDIGFSASVNYINNEPTNRPARVLLSEAGWPMRLSEADLDLDGTHNGLPVLDCGKGASGLMLQWGDGAAAANTSLPSAAPIRDSIPPLARFFQNCVIGHHVNDGGTSQANFYTAAKRLLTALRGHNSGLRAAWTKTPHSALNASPPTSASQTDSSAGHAGAHAAIDQMFSEGLIGKIVDHREADSVGGVTGKPYAWRVEDVLATYTTGTGSTTTDIVLASPGVYGKIPGYGYWGSCYLRIGSETKAITGESADGLHITTAAFTAAPAAGTTAQVIGITTTDGLHPSPPGHRLMARKTQTVLADWLTIVPRTV